MKETEWQLGKKCDVCHSEILFNGFFGNGSPKIAGFYGKCKCQIYHTMKFVLGEVREHGISSYYDSR